MSRMNEVLTIASEIAQLRKCDVVPAKNLWLRCSAALIHRDEFKAAIDEAIESKLMSETEDGQLLLIK